MRFLAYCALIILVGLAAMPATAQKTRTRKTQSSAPGLAQLQKMTARYAPTTLRGGHLEALYGDRQALVKLIEAGRIMNDVFLVQYWSGNPALYARLQKDTTALGKARLQYFWINKSPWSALDNFKAFLPGVPAEKPKGANFYPEDMTRRNSKPGLPLCPRRNRRRQKGFFTVHPPNRQRWRKNPRGRSLQRSLQGRSDPGRRPAERGGQPNGERLAEEFPEPARGGLSLQRLLCQRPGLDGSRRSH
jgi:hypothetical protein